MPNKANVAVKATVDLSCETKPTWRLDKRRAQPALRDCRRVAVRNKAKLGQDGMSGKKRMSRGAVPPESEACETKPIGPAEEVVGAVRPSFAGQMLQFIRHDRRGVCYFIRSQPSTDEAI